MSRPGSVFARRRFVGDAAGPVVVEWSPLSTNAYLHLAQEGCVGVED